LKKNLKKLPKKKKTTKETKCEENPFNPETQYKFLSWNLNGINAVLKKDKKSLDKLLEKEQPHVLCLQETKLSSKKSG